MRPRNRKKLNDRVIRAAEAALAVQKYVSPVDVLVGIGWLDPGALKRWERGQVEYLEGIVQTNLPRISEAMKLLRSWAAAKGLTPSETHYIARTPSRQTLRFSKSGNPILSAAAPSSASEPTISEPSPTAMPSTRATARAAALSPLRRIASGRGPTNAIPASAQASESAARSETKP